LVFAVFRKKGPPYVKIIQNHVTSLEPVQRGNFEAALPEFGRTSDIQRLFGIKRGTLYNLIQDGRVRSVLLRVRGRKSGLRLIELQSVRDLLRSSY
jgi:hypothetical protein